MTRGGETVNHLMLTCGGVSIANGVVPIQPFQGTVPTTFVLPRSGGTQTLSGGLPAPGGGWVNSGTVTVTRLPHAP